MVMLLLIEFDLAILKTASRTNLVVQMKFDWRKDEHQMTNPESGFSAPIKDMRYLSLM
jgi:hypothetical protein